VVRDIVVVDIPTRYGMFFSNSWGMKLGGSIKLGLTYATIPLFGEEDHQLYRESRFMKKITRVDCSKTLLSMGRRGIFLVYH